MGSSRTPATSGADTADVPSLLSLLEVQSTSSLAYRGSCLAGAPGRIFGGQVLAQALFAAGMQLGSDRAPHSLHAYFLRPGDPSVPVDYVVTPLKTGRTRSTARVDAHQYDRAILTALVSFHASEESPDLQVGMPGVTGPDELMSSSYAPPGSNPSVRAPVDIRYTDAAATSEEPAPPQQQVWFRSRDRLPDEVFVHACALAYATDLTLTRTAHMPLRAYSARRIGASLDHSMWFHRELRMDGWLLFVQHATSYARSRSLSHGLVFDPEGRLVASASQEALIRMEDAETPV